MPTEFLNTLEIPTTAEIKEARNLAETPAAPADDSRKPSAFVDGGSVVAFVADVSGQNREDVLNSTLLAQLAGDKQFNRETQVMEWYAFYTNVLGKLGWSQQGFNWKSYKSQQMSFTMDKVVLDIAKAALTGQELLVIAAALDAMSKLPEQDGKLRLFNHSASSETEGNFQISVCTETNGAVAMKTMAFFYNSEQQSTDVLFFNFSSESTDLKQSTNVQTLSSSVYGKVRNAVLEKLGKNAQDFVLELDI